MTIKVSEVLSMYSELLEMSVELDADPIAYGPKRLNNKTAELRNMLSRCERIALNVAESLHMNKRKLMLEESDFELQMDSLLATDPEVRAGRSTEERKALGNAKLREARVRIAELNSEIQDLESLMKAVKMKRSDLKDIQGRLRDQRNLCLDEIGLGARWGSKIPPESKRSKLEPGLDFADGSDTQSVDDVLDIFTEDAAALDSQKADGASQSEPVHEDVAEEASMDALLQQIEVPEDSTKSSDIERVAEAIDLDALFG